MADRRDNLAPPPPVVAVAGWLVPGAGYWLIGQRSRALTVGVTIVALFLLGVLLAGVRVVEAPDLSGTDRLLARILAKPWFLGQALVGPLGLVAAWLSHVASRTDEYAHIVAHARLADIGTLYTAVAGMLNLMAIIDATHRAMRRQSRPEPRTPDDAARGTDRAEEGVLDGR